MDSASAMNSASQAASISSASSATQSVVDLPQQRNDLPTIATIFGPTRIPQSTGTSRISSSFDFEFDDSEFRGHAPKITYEPRPMRPALLEKSKPSHKFFLESCDAESCDAVRNLNLPSCPFSVLESSPPSPPCDFSNVSAVGFQPWFTPSVFYDFSDPTYTLNTPQFPGHGKTRTVKTHRRLQSPNLVAQELRIRLLKHNMRQRLATGRRSMTIPTIEQQWSCGIANFQCGIANFLENFCF